MTTPSRTVVREFTGRHVLVDTVHPQVGRLPRGRIYPR